MKLTNNTLTKYSSLNLFAKYAIPGLIATLMANTGVLVDGMFVARFVDSDAFAAVNVSFPIVNLGFGIYVMLTVGAVAVAGKYIGEGRHKRANLIFSQTMLVVTIFGILYAMASYMLRGKILPILGAHGAILDYANEYFLPMLFVAFFMGTAYSLSQFARLDGAPNYASITFVLAAIINIILDYILIVKLEWGVAGAGWTTSLAQFSAFVMMIIYFVSRKSKIRFGKIYGGWNNIWKSAVNGFSELLSTISAAIIPWLFNITSFAIAGNEAIVAFSVANYAFTLLVMTVYALGESMQPLVSVSFGAKNTGKMASFLYISLVGNFAISAIAAIVLFINPYLLIDLLLKDVSITTIEYAVILLRAIVVSFVGVGINVVFSSYYTSVQKAGASVAVASFRSIILPIALLLVLPNIFGFLGIAFVLPISELATLILSFLLYNRRKPNVVVAYTAT